MSRLRLRLKTTTILGGGGGGGSVVYDTRFGTATDANGWITFDLKSGCRRVWVDASKADDTGNGLTAATAKKTWAAAVTVFTTGYTAGDQLMVATGTYTDSGSGTTFLNLSGASATYPLAVLSYDPADATNSAKYGKLTGSSMPVLNVSSTGGGNTFDQAGNSGSNYLAIQGLEIKGGSIAGVSINNSGVHSGVCFQNCRFNTVRLILNGDNTTAPTTMNVSKCSFWGQWYTDGNSSGMFVGNVDGLYIQDCVFVHCGWQIGQDRNAATSVGGPATLGHSYYYSAHNTGGRFDRNVCADSPADGHNIRGEGNATFLFALDEPIAFTLGGYSGSYTERPGGSLITLDYYGSFGGADTNASNPRGVLFNNNSTRSGSYAKYGVAADCPVYGGGNSKYLGGSSQSPSVTQALTIDTLYAYGYAPSIGGIDTSTYPGAVTWTNDKIEVAISGTANTDGGGNSVSTGSTFPSLKNRVQLMTAMGFTGSSYPIQKAQLLNAMLWRPDLPWAAALLTIALASVGITPAYGTASPPDMTGITPATIFGTSIGTMGFSSTTFAHASASSGTITGVPTGWMVWSDNLPSGLTINSLNRTWSWTSGTAGSGTFTLKAGLTKTEPVTQSISYTIT